jgi:hypothetical protein
LIWIKSPWRDLPQLRAWSDVVSTAIERNREDRTMGVLQIVVALVMVAVTVFIFVWFQSNQATASDRRRLAMMKRAGLDPGLAMLVGPRAAALRKKVRRRCQGCPREDLCDRWLAGGVEGGNAFCPNARVFHDLAERNGRPGAIPSSA